MMKRVIHLSKYSHSESAWGATIIAERWLLTAAHSFWDNRKKMQRKDLTVYHVYVGNPLAETNADYDIALVKLTGSIPINDSRITVAKLPDIKKGSNWPPPNVQCAISGWGCTYNRGPGQKTARAVWMRTMKKQECVDAYHIKFEWKPEMRFCAGHYKGGGATCIVSFV
ncbi:hypothetical protein PHET_07043 [Paragonimus heterotremus]|uniref:Peptidase S1 domain-containing protein n=1 Tax=Paragonimus heterotremus TaxID=100268 RepID=A0A8J4T6G8_9TREM|nr:hypothetical protein PHET_07043 [Paragonimus heterotremus]